MKKAKINGADYSVNFDDDKGCTITKKEVIYKGKVSDIPSGVLSAMKDDFDVRNKHEKAECISRFLEMMIIMILTLMLIIGVALHNKMSVLLEICIVLNAFFILWNFLNITLYVAECKYIKKFVNSVEENKEDSKDE